MSVEMDGIYAETATLATVVKAIQSAEEAMERLSPDQLKRAIPFIAEHVTPEAQTRKNVEACLWILAGFEGYTADVHK